ncbi:MAG TPA: anthranilate synthase component I [Peptococcaceae bacterium]|nr:MAG: Anthranilate synthase component I [Clostridia bacterium 41_269]HBT20504.1 anthranilate synthase component I [Peptococcaceae bacterium]
MKPGLNEFLTFAQRENIVPVWDEIDIYDETPISVFEKIADEREISYLLESADAGEQGARYSFMGIKPIAKFSAKGSLIRIEEEGYEQKCFGNPTALLKNFLKKYYIDNQTVDDVVNFCGGAVGYLSYDWVRYLENIPIKSIDDLGLPDGMFIIFKINLLFDHLKNTLKIIVLTKTEKNPEMEYKQAISLINSIKEKIYRRNCLKGSVEINGCVPNIIFSATLNHDDYVKGVKKILEYIRAGDIFQAVLSTRLETKVVESPLKIYRCLKMINPSPYMFYLNYPGFQLIGASPEMLVKVEKGKIYNRPIAGTRPRGSSEEEDKILAEELKKDPKEKAEHIMLVDLARNDVGRTAQFGTVRVPELMAVEKYSHVMHLVSLVEGRLAEDKNAVDALMACFPAGTVSGAPKVRAMEIIEELEPVRRGPYAGSVGYFSLNGDMDTCITIRTILIKDNRAYVQVGAGIVADSKPDKEYEECINKGKALISALYAAERRAIS